MTNHEIVQIVLTVLCAIGYGIMFYYKVRGNVFAAVSELIAKAEELDFTGSEKMSTVVCGLYDMIPKPLRTVFTTERLEVIAQFIFDWMRRYADEYIETLKACQSENVDESTAVEEANYEIIAEMITELLNLTVAALKEKASTYGVDIEGLSTKKEIIEAIVKALLTTA